MSHILLSYPYGPRSWLTAFRGKTYTSALNALLRDPRANVLVVYGDQDEFTGDSSYDAWVEGLKAEAKEEDSAALKVVKIEGATHFWTDHHDARRKMLEATADWLP